MYNTTNIQGVEFICNTEIYILGEIDVHGVVVYIRDTRERVAYLNPSLVAKALNNGRWRVIEPIPYEIY